MVYGKIIFNNIKEYTPSWIKTIPYSQTTKPILRKQPQLVGVINADPKVKRFWNFLRVNVQNYPFLWQFLILGTSFVWFHVCYDPWLTVYQANNTHVRTLGDCLIEVFQNCIMIQRSLAAAIEKEKAYQKKKAIEEGEE